MVRGWFDAFRENGAPTWYGENRTAVLVDTHTLSVAVLFCLFLLAFLLIFPGVRRERINSLITVVLIIFTGGEILIVLRHPCWQVDAVRLHAPYRAFSPERIIARLGMRVGLQTVNVTLEGRPDNRTSHTGQQTEHFYYNERFEFTEVRSMQSELRDGLQRGLPYPVLSVIQYLSVDRGGFIWGRSYRLAGYYTHAMLWLAFALWLLSVLLLCLVPQLYTRCLATVGAVQLLACLVYFLSVPNNLAIPFTSPDYKTSHVSPGFAWCFWLTLANGLLCLIVGSVMFALELTNVYTFATFLQVDFDEVYQKDDPFVLLGRPSISLPGPPESEISMSRSSPTSMLKRSLQATHATASNGALHYNNRVSAIEEQEEVFVTEASVEMIGQQGAARNRSSRASSDRPNTPSRIV